MNNLSNFLEKFKTFLVSSKSTKEAVIKIIAEVTSITLNEQDINIKDGIIYTKVSPMARNTIFMQKKKILEALKLQLADRSPHDIR